jgi:hypothetical protein
MRCCPVGALIATSTLLAHCNLNLMYSGIDVRTLTHAPLLHAFFLLHYHAR